MSEDFFDEIGESDWSLLEPHYKRDALFLVDKSLNLNEVGQALAKDDAETVKVWQSKDLIRIPSEEEVEKWEKNKFDKLAQFLIIQPFVIMQLLDL